MATKQKSKIDGKGILAILGGTFVAVIIPCLACWACGGTGLLTGGL